MTIRQMRREKTYYYYKRRKRRVRIALLSLIICLTFILIIRVCSKEAAITLPIPDNSTHPNSVFVCFTDNSNYIYEDGESNLWYQKGGHLYQNLKQEIPEAIVVLPGTFTMALKKDGTVWCKGNNECGQLGDGTNFNKDKFAQVIGLNNVVSISKSFENAVALKSDGTVWCWGKGFNNSTSNTPVQEVGLTDIVSISNCDEFYLALKSDGTVWYTGSTIWGHYLNKRNANKPKKLKGLNNIVSISAVSGNMTALKSNGTVMKCSLDYRGFHVSKVLEGVRAISAGSYHTIALKKDGTVWCWGSNNDGELGDGTTDYYTKPVKAVGLDNIISVSAGDRFSVALKNDGTIWEWGICNPNSSSVKRINTKPTIADYSYEFNDIIENAISIIDYSAPKVPSAHINGHVIVYDLDKGQFDYEANAGLPDDLRASSIDEDITFIFKKDSLEYAGSYTNNGTAYRYSVTIIIVNYSDNKLIPNKYVITLEGGDPPGEILESETKGYGSYPDIAGWIESHVSK